MKKNFAFFFSVLLFLDQFSKNYFIKNLKFFYGYQIKITSFLSIVYTWNYGISFGFFSEYRQYSNLAFLILNISITLYFCFLVRKSTAKMEISSYLLIICGAVGNIIDRIYRGAVFDFIKFHYNEYYFPVFNFADSYISIGAFLLFLFVINDRLRLKIQ